MVGIGLSHSFSGARNIHKTTLIADEHSAKISGRESEIRHIAKCCTSSQATVLGTAAEPLPPLDKGGLRSGRLFVDLLKNEQQYARQAYPFGL
jgi:hypothetical protein